VKWDKHLDYEATYHRLLYHIKRARGKLAKCYLAIALTQLRNGSRISEAARAFKEYLSSGKTEVYVKVSKKKKHEERLMIIPHEIIDLKLREQCIELLEKEEHTIKESTRRILYDKLKINTHSLRYAFINYMLKQGVDSTLISKIIKHTSLDTMLEYARDQLAHEILRKIE